MESIQTFAMKHTVRNIRKWESKPSVVVTEYHCGGEWTMEVMNGTRQVWFKCSFPENQVDKLVKVNFKITRRDEILQQDTYDVIFKKGTNDVISKTQFFNNETFGLNERGATITLEFHVEVTEPFKKTIDFQEPVPDITDVVILVGQDKFHVNKRTLAFQSPFFKSMFFGLFREANQEQVELNEISPRTFQHFLQVIHTAPDIDDNIVADLLEMSRMYEAERVTAQCEKFLMQESELEKEEKNELAEEYNLENLKTELAKKRNTPKRRKLN